MKNNNEVKNKMVELLESQVKLVKGLEIVKIKELSSKCKVTFKYDNMVATEELQKTCTPHFEIELCRKCINGAIGSMYINVDNLVEAKKWLEGEVWKDIDKENKENIDGDLLEILESIRIRAFKDYSKEKFIKCVKNEIRDMKKDNRLKFITNKLNDRDLIMVFIGILSNDVE